MKLMVISERTFMSETTSLLTGASFRSMQNGPVLSEVLNLMKGTLRSALWKNHVEFVQWKKAGDPSNHCVLRNPLPLAEFLSEFELGVLDRVWREHGHKTKWEIVDLTHEFPEWDEDQARLKSSSPITLESIYRLSMHETPEAAKHRAEEIAFFEEMSA